MSRMNALRFIPAQHEDLLREWLRVVCEKELKNPYSLALEIATWLERQRWSAERNGAARIDREQQDALSRSTIIRFMYPDPSNPHKTRASKMRTLWDFLRSNPIYRDYLPYGGIEGLHLGEEEENYAKITVPARDRAEVFQNTTISGVTARLDPDRNPWLVVQIPSGRLYPQEQITRRPGAWSTDVRIGRAGRGLDQGAEYCVLLVTVNDETHYQYSRYIRRQHENTDGMGAVGLKELEVLAKRLVIRGPW